MKGTPLSLAEGRILVEQLRLSMGNLGSTVIPTFLLMVLIFWMPSNHANAHTVDW